MATSGRILTALVAHNWAIAVSSLIIAIARKSGWQVAGTCDRIPFREVLE
ncbi:MAG: hypothetical protein ACRC62_15825 [Microcoleus sp.]